MCRIVEGSPHVHAYARNQSLGPRIPYQHGGKSHAYIPDFIVQINDGRTKDGAPDYLNLIVEIKGAHDEQDRQMANTARHS